MTTTHQQPTTAIVHVNPAAVPIALRVFGEERLALLKEQLGRGWKEPMTDAELEHIGLVCQRTRLDPLAKPAQIYFIKRRDSKLNKEVMTPQVSIDGLRLIAQRSREYGGQVGPLFCGPDGVWHEMWLEEGPPAAAKVGVWRRGFKEPLWAVATWSEWAQWEGADWDDRAKRYTGKKLATFWAQKPAHMLGKTAEAMAIKRSFPQETDALELAAMDQEWRAQQAQLAERHAEIFGADEDHTPYDLPPQRALNAAEEAAPRLTEHDGRVVDMDSGEVLAEPARPRSYEEIFGAEPASQEPLVPTREQDPGDAPAAAQAGVRKCPDCGYAVLDQRGQPINESQADLMRQRFGKVICRACAQKVPETAPAAAH